MQQDLLFLKTMLSSPAQTLRLFIPKQQHIVYHSNKDYASTKGSEAVKRTSVIFPRTSLCTEIPGLHCLRNNLFTVKRVKQYLHRL